MGLDVLIETDKRDGLYSDDYHDPKNDYFNKHSLSRTFCSFMCRQHVADGEPELDQIGRITDVDISPIYEMEKYWDDLSAEHQLSFAKNDIEKEEILKQIQTDRDSLTGNIDRVIKTVSQLIEKVSNINDLSHILNTNGEDTLDYSYYFTDFDLDKGEGYIDNNFGQDLRNFKRFLEYAKTKGAKTVYFSYG